MLNLEPGDEFEIKLGKKSVFCPQVMQHPQRGCRRRRRVIPGAERSQQSFRPAIIMVGLFLWQ